MSRKGLVYISLLLPVIVLGCATTDLFGNFNLISVQEEKQLGTQLSGQIGQESQEIQDPEITGYVQSIGQKLVSVSAKPNDPYVFHVLVDKSVNAFAIPGGHIYVQTGLIEAAESEAELAAVMAHELGHAENRHPTENMSRAMGTQMVMGMLLGKEAGELKKVAASLVANGGLSAYSRSAEREADSTAVVLLNRAGYDPSAMVSFFEKLLTLEEQQGSGSIGMSLFSSHPDTVERISNAKTHIASLGKDQANAKEIIGGFQNNRTKVKKINSQSKP